MFKLKLFYSYCHADEVFKDRMDTSMGMLKRNSKLETWSDREVIAGQKWSDKIRKEIETSNIVAFIITPDFLNSPACIKEWNMVTELVKCFPIRIVPIIARDCAWKDLESLADYQALPKDGKAIALWGNEDSAWQNIYEGFKLVISDIQNTFIGKPKFSTSLSEIEFCSQAKDLTYLEDVFVFPQLQTSMKFSDKEKQLTNIKDLLSYDKSLVIGDLLSGKSKLLCHIFQTLVRDSLPVLYVDLDEIRSKSAKMDVFERIYNEQFEGDFDCWLGQPEKTILFDNLTNSARSLKHVKVAEENFKNIVVATSTDNFNAYFGDEIQLSDYAVIKIRPFTRAKQESLIKNWLRLSGDKGESEKDIEHARVDKIERNINGIIVSNRVLPRYPFFILSILQTYELFMPSDLQITAYGHCYYALILAHIIKSGIERTDENINACFNFSSYLAFRIHYTENDSQSISMPDYQNFIGDYREKFLINDSLLNRLCSEQGICKVTTNGQVCFSLPYSYFFFLGRHLANTFKENLEILSSMMDKSYVRENTLTLIFAIHHANNTDILNEILKHTACSVDDFKPAKLDERETKLFTDLLSTIPERILSERSIEEERETERNKLDVIDEEDNQNDQIAGTSDAENQIYKLQKNMEILSQILKNKSGIIEKSKIEEIVQTICDAGLWLISIFLLSEDELIELTRYIEKRYEKLIGFKKSNVDSKNLIGLTKAVRFTIFAWTMNNIEKIVSALCKPELREIVKKVRDKNNTPAFDIIYYFYTLDVAESFSDTQKDEMERLVKKYNTKEMHFLQRVLSLRTQHYLNTHLVKGPIKQSVQSILQIEHSNLAPNKKMH